MVRGPGTLSMGHQVAEDTHRRDLRECSLLRPDRGAERELLCRLLTAAPVHGCQPREAQLSPTRPGLPLGRGQGPWAQRPYRAPPPPMPSRQQPGSWPCRERKGRQEESKITHP